MTRILFYRRRHVSKNKQMSSLTDIEQVTKIVESLFTILAIIVGAIWTYMLFVQRRQRFPRARIEHKVSCRSLLEGRWLLSVDVLIENSGDVLLSIISWELHIKQMLPPKSELSRVLLRERYISNMGIQIIEWETIASRADQWQKGKFEIEPGELHQIHSDFVITSDVRSVLIESSFHNARKRGRNLWWNHMSTHDFSIENHAPIIREMKYANSST